MKTLTYRLRTLFNCIPFLFDSLIVWPIREHFACSPFESNDLMACLASRTGNLTDCNRPVGQLSKRASLFDTQQLTGFIGETIRTPEVHHYWKTSVCSANFVPSIEFGARVYQLGSTKDHSPKTSAFRIWTVLLSAWLRFNILNRLYRRERANSAELEWT